MFQKLKSTIILMNVFHAIINSLNCLEPRHSGELGLDLPKILRLSQQNHIEIVEYIRGITFREAELQGKEIFENPLTLQKLGSVIVFDILINNWDRVPLQSLWKNEGNPKNIMIELATDIHVVTAIDQCITFITEESLLHAYKAKVISVISSILSGDVSQLEYIKFWILYACNYEIGCYHFKLINEGMKSAILSLAMLEKDEENFLLYIKEVFSSVEKETETEMGQLSENLLGSFKVNMFCNREFLEFIWNTIRTTVLEYTNK